MTLLVTSATGANGAGYGKILAFADDGKPIGVFGDDPYIVDPRGLGIDRVDKLLFVNSGSNRILALDRNGVIVRGSRTVNGLDPGGGNFRPDGRYYVGLRGERTIMAFTRELNSAGDTTISRFFCRSGGTNLERKDFWRAASTKLNLEALQDLIALTEESEGACPSNLERSGAVCRKRSGTRSPKISPRSCRR